MPDSIDFRVARVPDLRLPEGGNFAATFSFTGIDLSGYTATLSARRKSGRPVVWRDAVTPTASAISFDVAPADSDDDSVPFSAVAVGGATEYSLTVYDSGEVVLRIQGEIEWIPEVGDFDGQTVASNQFSVTVDSATPISVSLAGMTGPAGVDGDGTAYYGQTGRQTNGTVSIAASGTYYPINLASTIDSANSFGMVAGTGAALQNDTGESQLFTVIGSADCRSANNQLLGLKLAVDGVVIDASDCRANTGSNNYGKLLSQWIVELDDGEEVQLYIANHSATTSIDVNRCKLIAFTAGREGPAGPTGPAGSTVASGVSYTPADGTDWDDPDPTTVAGALDALAAREAGAISDNSITNAKLADVATGTIKGRATAGTGDPEDLSASEARTVLGLGTAATTDATDYATAAQGSLADSALQTADIDTLAELNAILTDATLIDTTDSRLSDARTPTAHASSHHTGGADALAPADIGAATSAQGSLADSAVQPGDLATVATTGAYADLSGAPTLSAFGASLVDDTDAATARATLDVDQAGTDNSTDVTLAGTPDYLTLSGQQITLGSIDLAADVTGTLPVANGGTGQTSLASVDAAELGSAAATDGYVLTADGAGGAAWEAVAGGGGGTVTSVALSGSDGIQVDSGSPITSSGTIALGIDASALSTHLSLGDAATKNTGTTSGTVAAGDHTHSAFTGDSGSGGAVGFVPAPAAGDAAAGKYLDADGTWTVPAGGGAEYGWKFLGSATASSSAQINVDNVVAAGYDEYQIVFSRIAPATDNVALELILRDSTPANIGGTYKSGFSYAITATAVVGGEISNQTGSAGWLIGGACGNAAGEFSEGCATINLNTNSAAKRMSYWNVFGQFNGNTAAAQGGGINTDTTAVAGFGLAFSSGNIASGYMAVYGRKNS